MPLSEEQRTASIQRLVHERELQESARREAAFKASQISSMLSTLDTAAKEQTPSIGVLDDVDRALSVLRHQISVVRRCTRTVIIRHDQLQNGVFKP